MTAMQLLLLLAEGVRGWWRRAMQCPEDADHPSSPNGAVGGPAGRVCVCLYEEYMSIRPSVRLCICCINTRCVCACVC